LSYDSADVLKNFAARRSITFPLLTDPESKVIRAFGLLNDVDYKAGHFAHGVPFPGTFVTDGAGIVTRKSFEGAYQERQTVASLLAGERPDPQSGTIDIQNAQFTLKTSLSNAEASPGQRLSIFLDFEMMPKVHAYARGVKGYRALNLRLDPDPLVKAHEASYPPSKPYTFAPLEETVPVYDGSFRVTQEVTLLVPPSRPAASSSPPETTIDLAGTLEYQTCSDTICHAPETERLRWTIRLKPLDRERAPEALRRRP